MGKFVKGRTIYKPVDEVDIGPLSDHLYISPLVKAPRMTGFVVRLFVWILECRIIGSILLYILKKDNLIFKLVSDADIQEPPVYVPLNPYKDHEEQEVKCLETNLMPSERVHKALNCLPSSSSSKNILDNTTPNFKRWKVMDYSQAYTSGKLTPLEVADRFIAAIDRSSNPECNMAFFINCDKKDILQQAKESTLRYEQGKPISVLDGVPVAIKDEIDCTPYPTTGGTKWLHKNRVCTDDAFCVKQLRKCGALLVGKTNMHELGAGTSGINPHYGAVRNPYNTSRISGGSSSGSAAVVCAGLCPVALGVDGGGSVRMPAALCGVVGLKPTFGRVPHSGVVPLNWTVGSVGILAATIEDALLVYAAISGEDSSENNKISVPKLNLPLLNPAAFTTNIKLVKYNQWFDDCSKDISLCCSNALDKLHETYGWEIVEMTVPDIETMRLAHYITIGCECTTSLDGLLKKRNVAQLGGDTRVALSIYGSFHSKDYLKAQKIRNREMQFHRKIFSQADFIVTPTTGVTAYELKDDALATGELDYINGAALVKYVISGNFLGLPAISIPIGYDEDGLPIGIQLIGKPWSEAALLKAAHSVQDLCIAKYKKPQVFHDLLT